MGEDSAILIDEMAFLESNVQWAAVEIDLAVMACPAAHERTKGWSGRICRVFMGAL